MTQTTERWKENTNAIAVRETIERLIEHGSHFHVDDLERIYHKDLKVIMIDERGDVTVADRAENMALFRSKRDSGVDPLSTWAEFNYVEAGETTGHVLVTRKMKLGDRPEKLVLSIDLVRENDRWQVIREVVFVRPVDERLT